ncbi:hypothetical protein FVP74_09350 [Microbacterium saccharophilum]|uniref:Uncharacterized protein n=1 Tax=Microbacterium saccharophilum TaxID=1213358 RepID=A0A5C8I1S2_9MICO|nr:hypothetical protein [Microbacterium saccharophilum]TXK11524.1 hypothetical protein FVP74_09350 [Microbacterium saccharophilum]GEP49078.1 hypothetical protein MSA03_25860 [Microbacterium saccharophilum]
MNTNPKAWPPFYCSGCRDVEIPAGHDHGILPSGGILCQECFAAYGGDVQILAPNRAAAVAALTARGQMTPATPIEGARSK